MHKEQNFSKAELKSLHLSSMYVASPLIFRMYWYQNTDIF